jgi:hypothetical protein
VAFWQGLWTLLWFGGLALFTVISALVIVHGARDLKLMLQGLRSEGDSHPEE